MNLTPIKIPEIPLPFDIPLLMHPPVDHFIIALPLVVLLLEIVNLFIKKRAIGVTSFFLLLLVVVSAVAAYLTGSVDGKEAYSFLSPEGQTALKAHKVLGTYLMLASGIVLIFKLLASIINRGLMKALFMFVLIFFVAGILKQGQEGGELVYKYGANTAPAKAYSDLMFTINDDMDDDDTIADLKEELAPESDDDEATETESSTEAAAPAEEKTEAPAAKEEASAVTEEPAVKEEAKSEESAAAAEPTEAAAPETAEKTVETPASESSETAAETAAAPEVAAPETEAAESTPEVSAPAAEPEVATH